MRPLYHPSVGEMTVQGILYALSDRVRVSIFVQLIDTECARNSTAFSKVNKESIPKSTLPQHFKILREAGLKQTAKALRFVSLEEPYDDSLTLDQAFLPDVMLALEMDGKPVSRAHGGPVRLVIPDMYGYKSVKWVGRIEALDTTDHLGYWEQRGYDVDAWLGRSNGYTS